MKIQIHIWQRGKEKEMEGKKEKEKGKGWGKLISLWG